MKKLHTLVSAMPLAGSLSFAQAARADTGKRPQKGGKKGYKGGKKGHKGGKNGKKVTRDTTWTDLFGALAARVFKWALNNY